MKKTVEYVFATIISLVIVVGGILVYLRLQVLENNDNIDANKSEVLGITDNTMDKISQVIINPNNFRNDEREEIAISSGIKTDRAILFDNTNREYLEGMTTPNSHLELILNGKFLESRSNPNGFFSIKLPENLVQFSKGELTVFDANLQILTSYRFILVLRQYLNRTYFLLENRNEFLSLQLNETFLTSRDQFNQVESEFCIANLNPKVNSRDFDIVENQNVVIFPSSILTLDFQKNKFVSFDIENKTETFNLDFCKREWRNFEGTLLWHTSQIDENFKNSDGFANPISSPE